MKINPDHDGPERAVIFVPPCPDRDRWLAACLTYCDERGYRVVSVLSSWGAVNELLAAGEADVKVTARREHLPARRRPREEVVSEQPRGSSLRHRRPRRRTSEAP